MIHSILRRRFPKNKLLKNSNIHFTFDVMERAYLVHWAMGVETYLAIGAAMLITILGIAIFEDGGEA